MNPSAPHIHSTIKLHKHLKPICPIVNWKGSPGYTLAKLIDTLLKDTIQLPNVYNIKNSTNLIHNLKHIHIIDNIKLYSFNIVNMYMNIPLADVTNIIKNILNINNHIPEKKKT
jgi:hypothetical protein